MSDQGNVAASKALRILEAHPEFEDLIWLMRSRLILTLHRLDSYAPEVRRRREFQPAAPAISE